MSNYTLVIIDMQPDFWEEDSELTWNIVGQIKRARRDRAAVLTVTFGAGKTFGPIVKALSGYKRKAQITKDQDDGSKEVTKVILRRRFPKSLLVCGVNTGACVQDTVNGLLKLASHKFDVAILESCCDDGNGLVHHKIGIASMLKNGVKSNQRLRDLCGRIHGAYSRKELEARIEARKRERK